MICICFAASEICFYESQIVSLCDMIYVYIPYTVNNITHIPYTVNNITHISYTVNNVTHIPYTVNNITHIPYTVNNVTLIPCAVNNMPNMCYQYQCQICCIFIYSSHCASLLKVFIYTKGKGTHRNDTRIKVER